VNAAQLSDDELLGRSREPIVQPRRVTPFDLVLLDRDGTLNVHRPGYICAPDELVLLPGAADAVRLLNEAGCPTVLITNQRGIATGELTWDQLLAVQRRLERELAADRAHLDAVQLCPHQTGSCDCRKPLPGLLDQALARAPWARPDRCVMIGDQPTDVSPAEHRGMHGIRIRQDGTRLYDVVRDLLRPHRPRQP